MNKSSWNREFSQRYARHEDELKWLYCELYHNDMHAYEYFVGMIHRAYGARPEALKRLDRQREANPSWYKGHDLVGMLMYVNAFAGTLNGVRERLDYIEESGVNYLHLMPLLESPEGRSDGGYAVSDFRRVQPELGTMDDLAALASDCHNRGINLCLDFVMNHTSEDHEWARRAKAGEKAVTFARGKVLSDAPFAVFADGQAFLLRKRSEDREHQLTVPAHRMNILFFEQDINPNPLQLSHRGQHRDGVH